MILKSDDGQSEFPIIYSNVQRPISEFTFAKRYFNKFNDVKNDLKHGSDKNQTSLRAQCSESSLDGSMSRHELRQINPSTHSQNPRFQCSSGRGVLQTTDSPTQPKQYIKSTTSAPIPLHLRFVAMVSDVFVPNNLYV